MIKTPPPPQILIFIYHYSTLYSIKWYIKDTYGGNRNKKNALDSNWGKAVLGIPV